AVPLRQAGRGRHHLHRPVPHRQPGQPGEYLQGQARDLRRDARGRALVLNYDDPFLRKAELPAPVRPVWYSMTSQEADVYASAIRQENDGMSFLLDDAENGCFMVHIPALGRHNVANALAAYCAASQLGLTPKEAIQQMKEFRQTGIRQHMLDCHGVRIIEDCYNANPTSMRAALRSEERRVGKGCRSRGAKGDEAGESTRTRTLT